MNTETCTLNNRISPRPRDTQIDTVKFLLIFSIYIFHFGKVCGSFYPFVNLYQVEIFFLVSGFWALNRIDKPILKFISDAFKKYLVFWLFWVLIYTAYNTLDDSLGFTGAWDLFVRYFSSIRATGISGMWFTPAFFFVSFTYFLIAKAISRIFKLSKNAIACICCAVSFIFFYVTEYFYPVSQKLIFSLGFVPKYMFYFSVGTVLYLCISACKERINAKVILKIFNFLVTVLAFANFTLYFFKKENLVWGWFKTALNGKLSFIPNFIMILLMYALINCIAKWISCDFTVKIGKNTLGLCHCEIFVKEMLVRAGGLLGFTVKADNPVEVLIFAFAALIVGCYVVLPMADTVTKRIISADKARGK